MEGQDMGGDKEEKEKSKKTGKEGWRKRRESQPRRKLLHQLQNGEPYRLLSVVLKRNNHTMHLLNLKILPIIGNIAELSSTCYT